MSVCLACGVPACFHACLSVCVKQEKDLAQEVEMETEWRQRYDEMDAGWKKMMKSKNDEISVLDEEISSMKDNLEALQTKLTSDMQDQLKAFSEQETNYKTALEVD